MIDWTQSTLGEIVEITMGQSPSGQMCNELGDGIPLLNGPTEFGSYNPTPVQFTTDAKKYSLPHDILFCVRGSTTGRMNWSDQKYAIGRGLASIRHKRGFKYNHYVRALIEYNLSAILGSATGSTFPNVSKDQLNALKIFCPSLEIQGAIAEILSSLDDKIELNNQINQNLEALAQAIFKRWFVDFEFPNENGQPYKSSGGAMIESSVGPIPKEWRHGSLSELIDIKHGFAFKGEFFSDAPTQDILVTPGNFKIGGGFNSGKFKYYSGEVPQNYILFPSDLIVTMTDLSKEGDTLGYSALVPQFRTNRLLHNQRIGKVEFKADDAVKFFLYWLMRTPAYRSFILSGASGTTVRHTSPGRIMEYSCVIPGLRTLKQFNSIIVEMHKLQSNNDSETSSLADLRDAILPRLISGEIEIQQAEKILTEA